MNIGFDAKRLFLNYTGLGNYSRYIVSSLIKHYPDNQFRLFTPRVKHTLDTEQFFKKKNIKIVGPPAQMLLKFLWRSGGMSFSEEARRLDVYHGLSSELPYFLPKKIKKVVTIHDLIFIRYPEYYKPIDRAIYKAKMKYACGKADLIIAVSQQTADDLIQFLNVPSEKIKVVYQGCNPMFNKYWDINSLNTLKAKYALPDKFILTVGTIEVRKNNLVAIKALTSLPDDIKLVMVGRFTPYKNILDEYIRKNNLTDRVFFCGNVEFADLPGFYRTARAFIYPSLFEGFGIPIIEAMTCGVSVISSSSGCSPEIADKAAIYFDPLDELELANCVNKLLNESDFLSSLVKLGFENVKRFQPETISSELMQLYNNL